MDDAVDIDGTFIKFVWYIVQRCQPLDDIEQGDFVYFGLVLEFRWTVSSEQIIDVVSSRSHNDISSF